MSRPPTKFRTEYKEVADSLDTLSVPGRLQILKMLQDAPGGELRAGAIREAIGGVVAPWHLRSLLMAGLVTKRQERRAVYYRANGPKLQELAAFLAGLARPGRGRATGRS
jgi:DNA-binding transcriptional ArsR family regulator